MKKTRKPNLSIYLSIFFHFSKPAGKIQYLILKISLVPVFDK